MKKIFIIFLLYIIGISQASANVLNSIEIKDNQNSYDIFLNTEDSLKSKTKIISNGELKIVLKNTQPAKNLKTIYNTSKINNLVINSTDKSTEIFIQAPDIKNATINSKPLEQKGFNFYWLLALTLLLKKKKQEQIPIIGKTRYKYDISKDKLKPARIQEDRIKISA